MDEQTASLPFASSLCGACFEACPVRIDIPDVLVHLRAKVVEHKRGHLGAEGLALGLAARTFATPERLARAEKLAGWAGRLAGRRGRLRLRGPFWIKAWFGTRDLVAPPKESFRAWWRRTRS